MVSPKDLFVTAIEVIRKSSSGRTSNLTGNGGDSLSDNDFLTWAADAKGYFYDLGSDYMDAMIKVYIEPDSEVTDKDIYYADEGLDKWYDSLPKLLIAEGDVVARYTLG